MKFATFCSGIEAPSIAWPGWEPLFFSEIDPFPRAVLAARYPNVPDLGDMTKLDGREIRERFGPIDLICAGTPCQSFSVAGLREGLDDPRGNLALTFVELVSHIRPRWVVWENVPGVLSSEGGRDFGTILGALALVGYGFAYRILDAKNFGVPQRRRRVFVVACAGGDWRRAAAVLFERASLRGDSPPGGETKEDIANAITSGASNGGRSHGARSGTAKEQNLISGTLGATSQTGGFRTTDLDTVGAFVPTLDSGMGRRRGSGMNPNQIVAPLTETGHYSDRGSDEALIMDEAQITNPDNRSNPKAGDPAPTINKTSRLTLFNAEGAEGATLTKSNLGKTVNNQTPLIVNTEQGLAPHGSMALEEVCPEITASEHKGKLAAVCFEPRFARNDRGAPDTIAPPLKAQSGSTGKGDAAPCVVVHGTQDPDVLEDSAHTLGQNHGQENAVAFKASHYTRGKDGAPNDVVPTLSADADRGDQDTLIHQINVRRLTPRECERLQGLPDDHTKIAWSGKPADKCPDGPRYKAIGNSMAVPVVRWIGQRIETVEKLDGPD